MATNRSLTRIALRFAAWFALLGMLAVAACNRAPSAPDKMVIAPAQPGTATGFAILRQAADENRQQEASDNRFAVSTAYVFVDRDSPEYYVIALLEKPLDNQKLAEATDPSDVIEEALRKGANGAVVMSDGDGDMSGSFRVHANGKSTQFGGSGTGDIRGLKREGDRVSGHVHYFSSMFSDHLAIDASFDAQLIAAPQGKPLPPDGGEAAEAYLATLAAMRAGDVDALVKLMAPERAKMIEAERSKPDFAENIAMIKMMAPESVEVTGGTSYGERVVLNTKGTDSKQPFTGTVEMNWEAGGWRMGNQSSRMGGSETPAADAPKEPKAEEPPEADLVPVMVDDGAACKGFRMSEPEFVCSDGFAVTSPDIGDNAIIVLLAPAKVDTKGAKAMWNDDMPLGNLFADGKPQPSMWLKLVRDERGELETEKVWLVDAEGNLDDTFLTFNAIESGGKLIGTIEQSGSKNGEDWKGLGRFNLPIVPAP